MEARVIHSSLNARGGSERLSLATIVGIHSLGFSITLETAEQPDFQRIFNASGVNLSDKISRQNTLRLVSPFGPSKQADLYINTHGDMIPYFRDGMTPTNSITYCHFPIAEYLIASDDREYERFIRNNMMVNWPDHNKKHRANLRSEYAQMLETSKVITNSQFSKRTIYERYHVDAEVIYPPVDIQAFRLSGNATQPRASRVLVVSRFHPSKRLENAIRLAALMKDKKISEGMLIVGNLSPAGLGYFNYIRNLVVGYGLSDFVKLYCNVEFSRLVALMRTTAVYLHPLPGEPFGIATVEAMSSGMIPVVHKVGGHTEFVPQQYWFDDLGSALDAIEKALAASELERKALSDLTERFSAQNYINSIMRVVREMCDLKQDVSVGELQKVEAQQMPIDISSAAVVETLTS